MIVYEKRFRDRIDHDGVAEELIDFEVASIGCIDGSNMIVGERVVKIHGENCWLSIFNNEQL